MRYEQIFVDATDTLLRVHGSVGELYAATAVRHGFALDALAVNRVFRTALLAAPPPCFPGASPADFERLERAWWHDLVQRALASLTPGAAPLPRDRFETFFAEIFALFRTTAAWDLLPGSRAALAALRAEGRRVGIVSEMDGRLLDVLRELELGDLFDPIVLSMRAGCSKRDGALYPYALQHTPVPAARCLHIGDSLEWDVEGARRAGLAVIYFDARQRGGAPPDVPVARHWSDVLQCIRSLEARR